MLHPLQPLVQAFLCIPLLNRNLFAADDWTGVNLWRHIVYCAAGHLHASIESLPDGVQSTEDGNPCTIFRRICTAHTIIGQERGVYVNNPLGELLKKWCAQDAHPTG